MAFLVFDARNKKTGDSGVRLLCTSATFNYQVIGNGTVAFYGSNVPVDILDKDNDAHWVELFQLTAGTPDTEPCRVFSWSHLKYKVVSGNDVSIFTSCGIGS